MKPLCLVLVPVTKFGPSFSFLLKLFSIVVKQKIIYHLNHLGFLDGSVVKNLPATAGDTGDLGLIPGWGRSPGGGNGNALQYSCLENPIDTGVGCSLWGCKESDITASDLACIKIIQLTFLFRSLEF